MSERKSAVILPLSNVLDSSSHQPFTLSAHDQPLEESFENFELAAPTAFATKQQNNTEKLEPQLSTLGKTKIESPAVKAKRQTHTRNYKLYAGKTTFFCGGRFLTSRAFWAFCISLFLLFAPCILFFVFT